MSRAGNRASRAGLGRANSGLGQNRARPKLARFFWAKILTAQSALKTGLVGPNNLLKEKKYSGGPGRTGPGHIGPGQIWPGFFWANNLMAQPGPNSGQTGLAHRVGPILPPLLMRLERIGEVAYRLRLPPELAIIHDVFRVSMLRKYIAYPSHVLRDQPVELKENLTYEERPVQIVNRKDQVLRNKVIPLVKVLWMNHNREEATWEHEDQMQTQYPHLF